MTTRSIVVIVDAYSTGKYLAPLLHQRGYDCVHVQSLPSPSFGNGHDAAHFCASVVHDGSLREADVGVLAGTLAGYAPVMILAGCESAVPLADMLASAMKLRGNTTELAYARREKHEMQRAIERQGLQVAKCEIVSNAEEARAAAMRIGLPIVIKPVLSAAAEDVIFCWDLGRVVSSVNISLGKLNALGLRNRSLLVQEMMFGTEYIVNSVSRNSRHVVSELWRCRKVKQRDGKRLSGLEELIPIASSTELNIIDFARRVLDALQISEGPSHMELLLTDDGPRLIEVAARPQGGVDPDALLAAIGTSHVHLTIEAVVRPELFERRPLLPSDAMRRVYRVILRSEYAGRIVGIPGLEHLRSLPSYYSESLAFGVDDELPETIDFVTTPGVVHLVSDDLRQLEADYAEIRRLEQEGRFFELATDVAARKQPASE